MAASASANRYELNRIEFVKLFAEHRKKDIEYFRTLGPVIGRNETGMTTSEDFTSKELEELGYKWTTHGFKLDGWVRHDGPCDVRLLPEFINTFGWRWCWWPYPDKLCPSGIPFESRGSARWYKPRPCGGPTSANAKSMSWGDSKGFLHRVYGPAHLSADGEHRYYIDGTQYTDHDYWQEARDEYLLTHPDERISGRLTKAAR